LSRPLSIGPENIGPEKGRVRGYKREFGERAKTVLSQKTSDVALMSHTDAPGGARCSCPGVFAFATLLA
jgi:hypothetical protein